MFVLVLLRVLAGRENERHLNEMTVYKFEGSCFQPGPEEMGRRVFGPQEAVAHREGILR